jgi:hypothetical protein
MLSIEFDPESVVSYGKWRCPKCGVGFYGGGPAIHMAGCELSGSYAGVTYLYTQKEKEMMDKGERPPHAPYGLLEAYQARV